MKLPNSKTVCKYIARLSVFMFFISVLLQIYASNKTGIKGSEIVDLNSRRDRLEREISDIQLEISRVSSFALVENKAKRLGFEKFDGEVGVISSTPFAAATSF